MTILQQVRVILSNILGVSVKKIKVDSIIVDDLDADDMDEIDILITLERHFSIIILDSDTKDMKTVGDLVKVVKTIKKIK